MGWWSQQGLQSNRLRYHSRLLSKPALRQLTRNRKDQLLGALRMAVQSRQAPLVRVQRTPHAAELPPTPSARRLSPATQGSPLHRLPQWRADHVPRPAPAAPPTKGPAYPEAWARRRPPPLRALLPPPSRCDWSLHRILPAAPTLQSPTASAGSETEPPLLCPQARRPRTGTPRSEATPPAPRSGKLYPTHFRQSRSKCGGCLMNQGLPLQRACRWTTLPSLLLR